jgi:hypothetical protein
MTRSKNAADPVPEPIPSIVVRHSKIHGNGVFARRKIPARTLVSEYIGEIITENLDHTFCHGTQQYEFFLSISDGSVKN